MGALAPLDFRRGGGLILAATELARLVAEGSAFSRALLFSLALGAGSFVFAGLILTAARRRDGFP